MQDSYIYYTDSLKGEYKEVFEKIQVYQSTIRIDDDSYEDRMMGLLDIFLDAQEKGVPVAKITGDNLERFCSVFCREGGSLKSWIFQVASSLRLVMWGFAIDSFVCLCDVLMELGSGNKEALWKNSFDFPVLPYIVMVCILFAVSDMINAGIRAVMFRVKKISWNWYVTFEFIWLIIVVAVLYVVGIGDIGRLDIVWWLPGIVSIVYLIAYYALTKERRRIRRENRISFVELVKMQAKEDGGSIAVLDKTFRKRFEKKNARLRKKGKQELSWEQFLDMLEKENERLRKSNFAIVIIIPLVIVISSVIAMAATNSFESAIDALFFVIVMLAGEFGIMYLLWKFLFRVGDEMRGEWLAQQRRHKEEP